MKKLDDNWICNGTIDFEYKKYILLAYLKNIGQRFEENKLYPFLGDIIHHYRNLISLKENKSFVQQAFPKEVSKIDLEKFTLHYESMLDNDEYMQEIQSILNFAIPKLQQQVNNGKEIYEFIEDKIELEPIGIEPLNKEDGYLFLSNGQKSDSQIYEFQLSVFESSHEKFRSLKTNFVCAYKRSLSNTYRNIKLDLIRNYKQMPNPATYLIASRMTFPLSESLLPIAKRRLVAYISGAA